MKFGINCDDLAGAVYSGGNVRVIVFVDKQANGATAAVLNLLETANIQSFRNMDEVDRFTILHDQIHESVVVTTNALHTSGQIKWYSINKKLNLPIHFSAAAGAITELRSNNIGILYISDEAAANVNLANVRVKFTDA